MGQRDGKVSFYAVKKSGVRKAGAIQRECLVVNLFRNKKHKSYRFHEDPELLAKPGMEVIAHIGLSKSGKWVFDFEGQLYVRYMRYEMTGNASSYERKREQREEALKFHNERIKRNLNCEYPDLVESWSKCYPNWSEDNPSRKRVGGWVHLWSGDIPWGSGKGKMALKPFDGELREDWR